MTRPRIRRRLRVIAVALVLLPGLVAAWVLHETWRGLERRDRERWRSRALESADRLARDLSGRAGLFERAPRERYALPGAVPLWRLAADPRLDAGCGDWRPEFSAPAPPCAGEATRFCAPVAASASVDALPCESAFEHFDRVALLASGAAPGPAEAEVFSLTAGLRSGDLYLFLSAVDEPPRTRGAWSGRDRLGVVASVQARDGAFLPARFAVVLEPDGGVSAAPAQRGFGAPLEGRGPGPGWARGDGPGGRRPQGSWRTRPGGWQLELRLPLRSLGVAPARLESGAPGALGLALVDVDATGRSEEPLRQRTLWLAPRARGALSWKAPDAPARASATGDLDGRGLVVLDRRLLEVHAGFEAHDSSIAALRQEASSLLGRLSDGAAPAEAQRLLAAARVSSPAGGLLGYVLEATPAPPESADAFAALRDSPLLAAALAASVGLLFALLLYTGRLSRRILTLVEDPGSERAADDEIGELSRKFSGLLRRVRSHRDYLAHLPRTLRHEVGGALNVVTMFLGNSPPGEERTLARDAVRRIATLIEDLAEARSLEDALGRGERLEADVIELLRRHLHGYREGRGTALEAALPEQRFPAVVIEGRVEEMLEKLLDNALDFSAGAAVRVSAAAQGGELRIRVENRGSRLPDDVEALFEPLCSGRDDRSHRHLGLGLYVARVIAEHHGGGIRAWNEGDDRVVFEVTLRGVEAAGAAPGA